MGKYSGIYCTSLKQESKTIVNSISSVVSFFVIIYIFRELWSYIYGGSGVGSLINGYNFNMMLWYMIIAEVFMYSVNARRTTRVFGSDIKTGRIAYQLNKPYNYFMYQIANEMGVVTWKLVFLLPTAIVVGLVFVGPIDGFSALFVLPMLVTIVLSCLLTCVIYGTIGLLCFWIEEASPFTWIIQKFQMLFGLFFPPEFFPAWLQPVINYSPVYAMMSGPSKLIANFSWELFSRVVSSQVCYIAIFFVIGMTIYKFGSKKVNINGG